jgi:hypothetical protein
MKTAGYTGKDQGYEVVFPILPDLSCLSHPAGAYPVRSLEFQKKSKSGTG